MNKKSKKVGIKKLFTSVLAVALMMVTSSLTAFAADTTPQARISGGNSVTFSNLDSLAENETIEFNVVDSQGNPATIGIERVSNPHNTYRTMRSAKSNTDRTWKVKYNGLVIHCHFYMTVSDNKVTDVYDYEITTTGGSFSDDSLTSTSKYGKLKFHLHAPGGFGSSTCWLKGTVTGSDNDITVTNRT